MGNDLVNSPKHQGTSLAACPPYFCSSSSPLHSTLTATQRLALLHTPCPLAGRLGLWWAPQHSLSHAKVAPLGLGGHCVVVGLTVAYPVFSTVPHAQQVFNLCVQLNSVSHIFFVALKMGTQHSAREASSVSQISSCCCPLPHPGILLGQMSWLRGLKRKVRTLRHE